MSRHVVRRQTRPHNLALLGISLLAGLLSALTPAHGQSQRLDTEAIIQALTPRPAPPPAAGSTVRSGRGALGRRPTSRGVKVLQAPRHPQQTETPSVNLTINFEYDSSVLTNDGIISLSYLGQALKDPRLANMSFMIIGHTDASGTDDYNLELSRRRADTVRAFLTQPPYSISANLLRTDGRGMRALLYPQSPRHPLNRRVQIVNTTNLVN